MGAKPCSAGQRLPLLQRLLIASTTAQITSVPASGVRVYTTVQVTSCAVRCSARRSLCLSMARAAAAASASPPLLCPAPLRAIVHHHGSHLFGAVLTRWRWRGGTHTGAGAARCSDRCPPPRPPPRPQPAIGTRLAAAAASPLPARCFCAAAATCTPLPPVPPPVVSCSDVSPCCLRGPATQLHLCGADAVHGKIVALTR